MEWQPIETSPELESVIVACPDGCVGEARKNEDGEWWWANSEGEYWAETIASQGRAPTHWVPLPAPPGDT